MHDIAASVVHDLAARLTADEYKARFAEGVKLIRDAKACLRAKDTPEHRDMLARVRKNMDAIIDRRPL